MTRIKSIPVNSGKGKPAARGKHSGKTDHIKGVRGKDNRETTQVKEGKEIGKQVEPFSLLTDEDIRQFQAGLHPRLYEKMGAHMTKLQGIPGTYFAVWAPAAAYVSVIGNFNGWDRFSHALFPRWDHSGIWEGFIRDVGHGDLYKFHIRAASGDDLYKGDPFASYWEVRPKTASIVWDLKYIWKDALWMKQRKEKNSLQSPFAVYEMHLGSWRRPPSDDPEVFFSYGEIAAMLVPYVREMGFTHIELMPIMEHPFDGSWGYQGTGYFAPTSRYGSPQDFMEFIDAFHRAGIGVILDWVPSHFPYDSHGLFRFDGSHVFEYEDMRKGFHKDWNSYIFNFSRSEVRSFMLSNALFWLEKYHIDGLRVDAVASMIHLDYSRKEGEWMPNEFGGNENLEAIGFLRDMNKTLYGEFPDIQTIAEESTSFYGVSKPVFMGGLGFGMKWMMGWMNDTLDYFKRGTFFRRWHQDQITFSIAYGFTENFMLPLSHDEVVHGKSSLIYKMPGDDWQKFANLRIMYTYMYTHPGTKLLFMGGEIAQTGEWNYKSELMWNLLKYESHRGIQQLVKDLNKLYAGEPALHASQFDPLGFEWLEVDNREECILAYGRKWAGSEMLIALNMTPEPRKSYPIGLQVASEWKEVLNSDQKIYWGTGDYMNTGILKTTPQSHKGKSHTITIQMPPLGAIVLKKI
ncbi:MAG TPA: 1,4-alpha-glucan branching protein GlgB [Chitinophagaceae bacterium]|nr:1,4-alpha-glucan branching protein GlgB [Chitinophagaceae bacterium]